MSLMDALLLDEYREPKPLWVNQRADGSKGSAAINDPAQGGVKALPDSIFGHTNGIPTKLDGLAYLCPAVRMTGLNGGIIQSNLIDLESPFPLQYLRTIPAPPSNPSDMANKHIHVWKAFEGRRFSERGASSGSPVR
ncbi:MAG: hypothetical protein HYR88_08820 [Verrucomicrobia bacterium]|nr:hypothetical protein [Verrucomicrobiota bacterium]MBI3870686.1 hypothetical protein [Verrucomicrobiota bacterium]